MNAAPIDGPESPILRLRQHVWGYGLEQVLMVERQFLRTCPQGLKLQFVIAVINGHQVATGDK